MKLVNSSKWVLLKYSKLFLIVNLYHKIKSANETKPFYWRVLLYTNVCLSPTIFTHKFSRKMGKKKKSHIQNNVRVKICSSPICKINFFFIFSLFLRFSFVSLIRFPLFSSRFHVGNIFSPFSSRFGVFECLYLSPE